jgi:hypothetical protein
MGHDVSRRGFLKGMAMAAGAFGASRLPGMNLVGRASAAPGSEPGALLVINLIGGYNSLFCAPRAFAATGAFSVTSTNIKRIGTSNQYVDAGTLGTLSPGVLGHMATIGVKHGITSHTTARRALLLDGQNSRLVKLSAALGGTGAVRCAVVGDLMPVGTHPAIGDVSLQQIRDVSTTITALGGTIAADAPDRAIAADGIAAAEAMSKAKLVRNPASGRTLAEGYPAASALLRQTAQAFDYDELASAYDVQPNPDGSFPTEINRFPRRQIMAAELMIRAGANVVIANQEGWDSHNDDNGLKVRDRIAANGTLAAVKTFTDRMMALPDRNVVTVILGDFARSLPGSDHQPNLSVTVIGKYCKLGSTGNVNANVGLPAGTPGIDGLWAYLAAVAGATGSPFGANPHDLVLAS